MKPIARKDNLKVKRETGELFIEDLMNANFIHLNPTSAYVWEKCDGQKEPNQIAIELGQELGVPVSEGVISMALSKLSAEKLLLFC